MPTIMKANRDAVRVWSETRTQVIAGMESIIDINILAVKLIMDLYGIKHQRDCMWRVRVMFSEYKAVIEEKRERERAKSKD
jgi:hypothetical protein